MAEVLFLYATREGQTRRICQCMADELRAKSHGVQLLPLDDERSPDALAQCRIVVLGASIHYGHFPDVLYEFIERNRSGLDARHSTFFCVNLTARKPGKDSPEGSAYTRKFLKKTTWRPKKMAVFAGALLYSRYTWYERLIIRMIMWITNGPTDTSRDVDFTDWDRVRRFSNSVFE